MRLRSNKRPGNVLVLFALLVFALLALAALVIDLGFVRTTQQRMRVAADTAALQGLRGRDLYLTDGVDPATSDSNRRQAASDMARYMFNDTLATDQDPNYMGAGPVIDFTGGLATGTNFMAAQDYDSTAVHTYKPILQLNGGDAIEGDLVAGSYTDGSGIHHQEGTDSSSPFGRDDFTPRASGDDPNVSTAFLVRLRRSRDPGESGIASSGPVLPYLFARGTVLALNSKAAGIVVRATGIAAAMPVLSVGQPVVTDSSSKPLPHPLPGGTPFVLKFKSWQNTTTLPRSQAISVVVQSDGTLTLAGANPISVGYAIPSQAFVSLAQTTAPDPNPPAPASWVSSMLAEFPRGFGYVPIFDALASPSQDVIVGFGFVNLAPDPSNNSAFFMTIHTGRVAPDNASGVLVGPAPSGASLALSLSDQLQLQDSLLTAVSVRAMGPSTIKLPLQPFQ